MTELKNRVTIRIDGAGVALFVPEGQWEAVADDRVPLAIALTGPVGGASGAPEDAFRPNIVVERMPRNGASLPSLSSAVIATELASPIRPRLVAADRVDGGRGRRLVFSYRLGPQRVIAVRYVLPIGEEQVHVTCSCAAHQFTTCIDVFDAIATRVEITGGSAPRSAVDAPEPRLDERASALAGEPLETLSGVATVQQYRADGAGLSMSAVAALASAGRSGRLSRSARPSAGPLERAGLVDARLRSTPRGDEVAGHLAVSRARLVVVATTGTGGTRFDAAIGDATALLLAGVAPSADLRGMRADGDDRDVHLRTVPIAEVVDRALTWVGVQPVWSTWSGAIELDQEVVEHRRHHREAPTPDGLPDALVAAWAGEWCSWWWRIGDLGLRVLTVPGVGQWQMAEMTPGRVRIAELPTADLYRTMLDGLAGALAR